MDNITLQLNNPITEDQWDAITDVDFENTEEILFTTKHKKNVRFVKAQQWIPCSERLPEKYVNVLCYQPILYGSNMWIGYLNREMVWVDSDGWEKLTNPVTAWMPLPASPYREEVSD